MNTNDTRKRIRKLLGALLVAGSSLFLFPACATEGPNEEAGEARDERLEEHHEAEEEYHDEMEDAYDG